MLEKILGGSSDGGIVSENRGVSPVIGVILMVAITVILAATIGAFVLGLGENMGDSPVSANAQITFDQSGDEVSVTHQTEASDSTELQVTVEDASGTELATSTLADPGDKVTFDSSDNASIADGNEVRVVVEAVDGDRSTIIRDETDTL